MPNNKVDLKAQKVALGLIDNFVYDNVDGLEEEASRLSYSVEEWFPEKFDQWFDIGREIYSVYFQNSEAFINITDIERDREILQEIETRAEELGLSASEVYPDWQRHFETINYVEDLSKRFDEQKDEFSRESKSV